MARKKTHGGRRRNQTGRPPIDPERRRQVKCYTPAPETVAAIEAWADRCAAEGERVNMSRALDELVAVATALPIKERKRLLREA